MSAYWHYLAEASASIDFVCRRDIVSHSGLVLPAGSELNLEQLSLCELEFDCTQIETLLALKTPYTANVFDHDLLNFRGLHSTIRDLYDPLLHSHFYTLLLSVIEHYPSIAFRLAVLKVCLPFEFSRTLFCLYLVLLESQEVGRDDPDFFNLSLVAIGHDLGLLDISPRFTRLDHDPRSTKDDVDGYYRHVHFSAAFLERQGDISNKVIRSIKQHHESMDGTGYPAGASGNALSEYGQHIHLYDTLYSIYTKNYLPFNKRLADLKPVIEINAVTHFGQVAVRLVAILSRAKRSNSVFFKKDEFERVHRETELMAEYIEKSISAIQGFTSSVGFRHEDKALFSLQNGFIHIALSYYKLRVALKQASLANALSDTGDYLKLSRALEDNVLSLREIIFHIEKFLSRLQLYCSQVPENEITEQAGITIEIMSKLKVRLMH